MSRYTDNLKAWAAGWGRFDEINFKAGWSGKSPRWWLLYGLNYGTRVLAGGACISWSRWFHLTRDVYPASRFMDRLLSRIDSDHGAGAGPPLWGTAETKWAATGAMIFWPLVAALVAVGFVSLVV